jgi:hypothetical protein
MSEPEEDRGKGDHGVGVSRPLLGAGNDAALLLEAVDQARHVLVRSVRHAGKGWVGRFVGFRWDDDSDAAGRRIARDRGAPVALVSGPARTSLPAAITTAKTGRSRSTTLTRHAMLPLIQMAIASPARSCHTASCQLCERTRIFKAASPSSYCGFAPTRQIETPTFAVTLFTQSAFATNREFGVWAHWPDAVQTAATIFVADLTT